MSVLRLAPGCVWFTGLPAAGKSTLASRLADHLRAQGTGVALLDGDALRQGLCRDLGFGEADRAENVRRASHVARLMADAGLVAVAAFVSPYAAERDKARALFPAGRFVEVFVDASAATCRGRDPKGLYARAARGEIRGLTGFDDPYEPPAAPEVHLRTDAEDVGASFAALLEALAHHAR